MSLWDKKLGPEWLDTAAVFVAWLLAVAALIVLGTVRP